MKREEAKKEKAPNVKEGMTWGETGDKDKKDRSSAIWKYFDRVMDEGDDADSWPRTYVCNLTPEVRDKDGAVKKLTKTEKGSTKHFWSFLSDSASSDRLVWLSVTQKVRPTQPGQETWGSKNRPQLDPEASCLLPAARCGRVSTCIPG